MKILGIHDGHNASCCLYEDGNILAALQEERITRVKNEFCFPEKSIKKILKMYSLIIKDIDKVVFASNHMPYPKSRDEMLMMYSQSEGKSIKILVKQALRSTFVYDKFVEKRRKDRIQNAVKMGFDKDNIEFVEHHTCHASTAYWGSDFDKKDKVLVLTMDGAGDRLCSTVNIGEKGKLARIAEVEERHSIGSVYAKVTYLLGMVPNEHEFKLMGMAPYGDKKGAKKVYDKLKSWFEFQDNGLIWEKGIGLPHTLYSYEFLKTEFERMRFDWICRGLQDWIEDFLCQWVKNCIKETGIHKIALSGGVFMNVKANKEIYGLEEVEQLFVYPSCGDETNAIGAAYDVYSRLRDYTEIEPLADIYFGPNYSNDEILAAIQKYRFQNCKIDFQCVENIEKEVAELLENGEVVARFAGREEFGARTLGNRSILGDASNMKIVKVINEMIKNRDFWMPFACSILAEREKDYIVNPKNMKAPYMIMSFDTTDKIDEIIAGCHPYDCTVRPQIVEQDHNPRFYKLISEFQKITGRGAILNTSFNLHGFPIVSHPKSALEVFDESELKYLALENYLVRKVE
jgi:carbamoyltransferase